MLINYNLDGLEDLSEFSYIYKRDVFRKGSLYYKFISQCCCCGKSFFMRLSPPTIVCSVQCSNRLQIVRDKISKSLTGHKRSLSECKNISKRMSKGDVVCRNIPLFDTYAKQLLSIDEVRNVCGVLEVKCSLCLQWFVPKRTQVIQRVQFIKGNVDRENRFYCSDKCKTECPVFYKHKYQAGHNVRKSRNITDVGELKLWSQEVLKRANYTCEICGESAEHAHHIQPKKLVPGLALDPENGLALCKKCHYKYGHRDGCSTGNLAHMVCRG